MKTLKLITLTLSLLAPDLSGAAPANPANYAGCKNRVSGTWAIGMAPDGCDLGSREPETKYPGLIFDERNSKSETQRYAPLFKAFLGEAADYYLSQRRRSVDESEKKAWRRAVFAMVHQESFWSHYRVAKRDEKLKLMRGDYGHGYGLTQVDDRWHNEMIRNARATDLMGNLLYGLDMYFQGWERAAKSKCVAAGNWEQRSRAAYSYYNGGPSKPCRWTNPSDAWARNDKGYLEKYRAQVWAAIPDAPSPVNVAALAEGGTTTRLAIRGAVDKSIEEPVAIQGRVSRARRQFLA